MRGTGLPPGRCVVSAINHETRVIVGSQKGARTMLDVENLQLHRKALLLVLLFVLGSIFCRARFFDTPHCLRNVFDFSDELIYVQACDESKGIEPNLC